MSCGEGVKGWWGAGGDLSSRRYLVLAHTPFLGEVGAGGALLIAVAVVKH